MDNHETFAAFAAALSPQSPLRARITAAWRRPERKCVAALLDLAQSSPAERAAGASLARRLVEGLRRRAAAGGAEGLLAEYSLSSQEGVALMCLAEALLRIPDAATRDALIRDKIATADWRAHLGHSPSLFVNAATWGLVLTGTLTATSSETGLSRAITRLIGRGGEPLIRGGVAMAMRMMGEQFVTGQTIAQALTNSRAAEALGYRFSYDMLGEAAMTQADALRYTAEYEAAIRAIGRAASGRGIHDGPGISVKLSALHPRYSRSQRARVMTELLPRLRGLAVLAREFDIGLNIDAEESDRLELSLDLLEALCLDPALADWNGIGFVVQAYGKRCSVVIDFLIDLAQRSGRRLMVRLVKGAYWDSEIKRAQIDGLDFPVFTRKVHTDVSYLACARQLLRAPDAVFPQFATHNAQTLAAIAAMAGADFQVGQYEFQCLHGMGEPLYDQVVDSGGLNRPCRVYAPVGTHETLLSYLVRRLLENGANSSFVNRVADPATPIDQLIADPVEQVRRSADPGAPHPGILQPVALYGPDRRNASGLDLANEQHLAALARALPAAESSVAANSPQNGAAAPRPIFNPADHRDLVGLVADATAAEVDAACARAVSAAPTWGATPAGTRADCLARAADLIELRMMGLIGPLIREAGKSFPAAISELREAVDFLRYYGSQIRVGFGSRGERPLGVVACISPWNFPAAIFAGQIGAALAAGNVVLAKPAEQTPLIALAVVGILHEAGVPTDALQCLPGDGRVGAALIADERVAGVVFTGSGDVARTIQRCLAGRLTSDGKPIPFIAETGGLNTMIVDSSALAEQVVTDVLVSAFDSAGQRCSALRILCVQEDVAGRTLEMLHGALAELKIGNPARLSTDVGPVIDAEARDNIVAHIERMRQAGFGVTALGLPEELEHGTYVAPTIIEVGKIGDVDQEVFGPVLHVVRFARDELDRLLAAINATGYGLTAGLHTRIDETIAAVTGQIMAGNIYVNRNIVGAVVGVQPFGGEGLSGTGPKAGGPLYLHRLIKKSGAETALPQAGEPDSVAVAYCGWLERIGRDDIAVQCRRYCEGSAVNAALDLPGPVGETNRYRLVALGAVLALACTEAGALLQVGVALATGNRVVLDERRGVFETLPAIIAERIDYVDDWRAAVADAVLFEGSEEALMAVNRTLSERSGPLVRLQVASRDDYQTDWLLKERVITTNTAAAGGNATLMILAEVS